MPVIDFLHSASADLYVQQLVASRSGLKEGGFVEGQNLTIEYRLLTAGGAFRVSASSQRAVRSRYVPLYLP
jgi:hypothetical protein